MKRRTVLGSIAGGIFALPLAAFAQQDAKVWRVGFLYFGSRQSSLDTGRYDAFVQGMRELGYVEGKNLVIEARFGEGKIERLPGLVAELARLRVGVIVATGSPVYSALRKAGSSLPVVVTVTADPVIEGLAASLARPGGTFTGLSDNAVDLCPKQFELLRSVLPQMSRVGVLLNPDNGSHRAQMKLLQSAAQLIGVQVVLADAGRVADIEPGFAKLASERADGVILFGDTFYVQQLRQIAQAALSHHLPSLYLIHDYPKAGGLMSYGPDIVERFRRAPTYVDKIFKGAMPGELPFEQPERYTLAVNLTTAKALGLSMPQSLLLRADETIE